MKDNMITGRPARIILAFSLPMIIGNVFQQVYVMTDTWLISRVLGVSALSAVGCTGTITYWINGIVTGFVTGLSVCIAQYVGAKNEEGIKRSFAASIVLSVGAAVIVTVVSLLIVKPMLVALRTPEEVIEDAFRYLSVLFMGLGTSVLFHLSVNVVRALGDSRRALYFMILLNLLNVVLECVCICLLRFNIVGISVATVLAQLLSGLACFWYIKRKVPRLQLRREHFSGVKGEWKRCLKIALPMAFQTPIVGIGLLIMQYAINGLGTEAVAAYTAATRVENFAELLFISFGVTMCTYVAQNYGAGKMDRVKKGVFQCMLISVGTSMVFLFIQVFAGRELLRFFIGNEEVKVLEMARSYLAVLGFANVFLALLYVFRYTLQGLGRTLMPVVSGFVESAFRIFASLVLVGAWAFWGVQVSHPLAWAGACFTVVVAYYWIIYKKYA